MKVRVDRLESIVKEIAEAMLATTRTVECMAERVDALAVQVQQHSQQVQQQGYQMFALTDTVQTVAEIQQETLTELRTVSKSLQQLLDAVRVEEHQHW